MGGKMKQSQRTKNNVRPSSSGRSAELLSNSGSAFSSLSVGSIGSPTKPLPALFPTLASLNSDQYLKADLMLCLKKLNKKDSTTKTKALQELIELVNSSTVDDVIALLPFWTRAYRTLSTDPDHKVREATQLCHGAIVSRSGRALGPQLKQVLWWWLQAQYDSFPPAAAAAQRYLNSTFPENKLPNVISFCKSEVMVQLLENFIGNTEASLQSKGESSEAVEIQYERILLSSLQGLQYFARYLTDAHRDWLWEQLKPLLEDKRFWKLANHKSAQIRAAWFSSLGVLIERYKQSVWDSHGARLGALLLAASKEREPLVAAPVWTALLLTMYHVQNWHEWIVDKKLLTKRIFDILENGGWGDAKHLSTMVLPLLAHLPSDILTQQFYGDFFNALFAGLEKKAVLSSKSERQLWITSITDCLRYVSLQETDFAIEVTTSVHRTLLEKILSGNQNVQQRSNLIKNTATGMVAVVKYWLKQSKQGNSEKFDQLIRNYWQNIGSTILGQIDKLSTDNDEIGRLIEGHILLLQTLKTSFLQEAKKKQSIKFDGDSVSKTDSKPDAEICDVTSIERYTHNLNELAEKVCAYYLEFAEKKQVCNAVLTPLLTLIMEFDSKKLFTAIARHFSTDSAKELTVYGLYDSVLKTWLAGDTMRCKSVVDVVFLMLKHLSDAEQDSLLESFKQFPPSVVEICISLCLSHPHSSLPSVRRFMQSALVETTLLSVCKRLIDEADCKARNLLLMSLSHDAHGEMIISNSTVSSILALLTSSLSDLTSSQLEHTASVCAQVLSSIATQGDRHECRPLMLRIFYLNLVFRFGDKNLTLETYQECKSAWQDGLAALTHEKRLDFLNQAVDTIKTRLADSKKRLNLPKIDHIACLCPHLIYNLNEIDPTDNIEDITSFTRLLFNSINSIETVLENDQQPVEYYALRHDCIKSNLQCPFDDDNDLIKHIVEESSLNNTNELAKENLTAYANKVVFRALFLRAILLIQNDDEDDDELGDKGENKWCNSLLGNEFVQKEFSDVIYSYAVINSLHEGYAFWQDYDLLVSLKTRLDSLLDDVIAVTSQDRRSQTLKNLANKAATDGYYWAYAARHYAVKCSMDRKHSLDLLDISNFEQAITGNGFYHTLQANTKSSSDTEVVHRAKFLLLLRGFYLAHAGEKAVLDESLIRQLVASVDTSDVEVIIHAYHRHNHVMLYDRDITSSPWLQVLSNAAIVDYLTAAIHHKGWDNSAAVWDFTTITLCSLLNSLHLSKKNWACAKVVILTRSVLQLYAAAEQFISSVNKESESRQPSTHVAHLPTEWKDIFAPDITGHLYQLILHILECHSGAVTSLQAASLSSLPPCLPAPPASLPPSAVVSRCTRVMGAVSHHGYKYVAHHVLCASDKTLVLEDVDKLSVWSSEATEESTIPKPELSLTYFRDTLQNLYDLVDAALSGVTLGEETCEVVPNSDSYSVALGYLLLVEAMYRVCARAKGDLVHHYIEHFRQEKYAGDILSVCVRLLPAALCRADVTNSELLLHAPLFCNTPAFSVHAPASSPLLSGLACRLTSLACSGVSADGARGWRGAHSARVSTLLSRTVAACVTPQIVNKQLVAVQANAGQLGEDTEVTIHWSSQEVIVIHRVDDRPIELTISLARDHPLTLPQVVTSGGPQHNTQWIAVYLSYQNGAISDAIRMWTDAVTRRVEASPSCYICYCRLHPASGTLPKTTCHQCRNKYHTQCLQKWFSTSNKSNCPLCRATF